MINGKLETVMNFLDDRLKRTKNDYQKLIMQS